MGIGPPQGIGPVMEIVVFVTVVIVRAIHPVVIDASKTFDQSAGREVFPFQASSVIVLSTFLLVVASLLTCLVLGGRAQFRSVFRIKPLILFSISGIVCIALGSYAEMASMGNLHGAAYQIILQSKIIVTASFLTCVKGVYQTRLQWTLLSVLMCAMSFYMIVISNGDDEGGTLPILGVFFAFVKVGLSCIGAVVADKYMKVYIDPTHVQIARTSIGAFVATILLYLAADTRKAGFFSGWDGMTCVVAISFVVKNASTIYILALLDSILKNIAESVAILVIYAYDVLAPWVDRSFDVATFLAVSVVVSACAAYLDSKVMVEKAALYDYYDKAC